MLVSCIHLQSFASEAACTYHYSNDNKSHQWSKLFFLSIDMIVLSFYFSLISCLFFSGVLDMLVKLVLGKLEMSVSVCKPSCSLPLGLDL